MAKRNIGNEIITGLEEIKARKRGEVKLRTFAVELPRGRPASHPQEPRLFAAGVRPVHGRERGDPAQLGAGAPRTPWPCAFAAPGRSQATRGSARGFPIRSAESEEEGILQGTLNPEAFSFPENCVRRAERCRRFRRRWRLHRSAAHSAQAARAVVSEGRSRFTAPRGLGL